MVKKAIIIGAGPAGLTAAYELLKKTDIKPIIIEKTNDIGGIAKTIKYNGNRIDIGGHRFFSKSDKVMEWWQEILPIQGSMAKDDILLDQKFQCKRNLEYFKNGPDPEKTDEVMLIRHRLSRIFFLRKFFDYPITINSKTIINLGFSRIIKIGLSYLRIKFFPIKKIDSLEDFFISRFGKQLYQTFFKDYTQKVWGLPCDQIAADWGAQRVKELSVSRAILHALKSIIRKDKSIYQKDTDTSLIENFLYPKYGPGQLWESVARIIENKGGILIRNSEVTKFVLEGSVVKSLTYFDHATNEEVSVEGDYFLSTMPVKELIYAFGEIVPAEVRNVSQGLKYRDFITVGLLLNKLKIINETKIRTLHELVPDSWIYIQERDVKVGRIQVFNNWSPYMVADITKVWIGLEYFCNEGDELWSMKDPDFINFAIDEVHKIGIIDKNDVLDSTIIRVDKTYPAYFGTFSQFDTIREYTDEIHNLFLIGRNGMHKYNNQDHSMLTAMTAVENIINNKISKENIWMVNTENNYHESKTK